MGVPDQPWVGLTCLFLIWLIGVRQQSVHSSIHCTVWRNVVDRHKCAAGEHCLSKAEFEWYLNAFVLQLLIHFMNDVTRQGASAFNVARALGWCADCELNPLSGEEEALSLIHI